MKSHARLVFPRNKRINLALRKLSWYPTTHFSFSFGGYHARQCRAARQQTLPRRENMNAEAVRLLFIAKQLNNFVKEAVKPVKPLQEQRIAGYLNELSFLPATVDQLRRSGLPGVVGRLGESLGSHEARRCASRLVKKWRREHGLPPQSANTRPESTSQASGGQRNGVARDSQRNSQLAGKRGHKEEQAEEKDVSHKQKADDNEKVSRKHKTEVLHRQKTDEKETSHRQKTDEKETSHRQKTDEKELSRRQKTDEKNGSQKQKTDEKNGSQKQKTDEKNGSQKQKTDEKEVPRKQKTDEKEVPRKQKTDEKQRRIPKSGKRNSEESEQQQVSTKKQKQKQQQQQQSSAEDAVRQKCKRMLQEVLQSQTDEADASSLSEEIERCLFAEFGSTEQKYKTRLRSCVMNLRDPQNPNLRACLLSGCLAPEQFARMSTEEMASDAMRQLRERLHDEAIRDHQMADTGGSSSSLFKCKRCRKNNCTYHQLQILAGDEPMTTYLLCNECGFRWSFT